MVTGKPPIIISDLINIPKILVLPTWLKSSNSWKDFHGRVLLCPSEVSGMCELNPTEGTPCGETSKCQWFASILWREVRAISPCILCNMKIIRLNVCMQTKCKCSYSMYFELITIGSNCLWIDLICNWFNSCSLKMDCWIKNGLNLF